MSRPWTVGCRCHHEKVLHIGTICIGHKHNKSCGPADERTCTYGPNCACTAFRAQGVVKAGAA